VRTVTVGKPVRDVDGLLEALRKADPPLGVISLGSDDLRTYVFMEEGDTGDPAPVVEGWQDAPELRATSMSAPSGEGVAEVYADGVDTHSVLIRKTTPSGEVLAGSDRVEVTTRNPVEVSNNSPKLKDGEALVQVGPTKKTGEVLLEITDPSAKMRPVRLRLRFARPQATEAPPVRIVKRGGIMAALRRLMGGV
jgi:hypothetical protein